MFILALNKFGNIIMGRMKIKKSIERKEIAKRIAKERIEHLFSLARKRVEEGELEYARKYVQLAKCEEEDEFICKVARTPKEIADLIEAGFEYVLERDGMVFFRKRK